MSARWMSGIAFVVLLLSIGERVSFAEDKWSVFRPLCSPPPVPPKSDDSNWSQNPIDAFVYARLKQAGLKPAALVNRRVWIRRVTFDLVGLPPAPDEVRSFVSDPRPDPAAYSAVVDRLLASPQYDERWASHWLDVVRYADTDGFAIDAERPTLWRFRDYVIRAFNEDRPFDRFIREQLAGDEIDAGSEGIVVSQSAIDFIDFIEHVEDVGSAVRTERRTVRTADPTFLNGVCARWPGSFVA